MHIAINASVLRAPRTGIGHYVAELVMALEGHSDIELNLFDGWHWIKELPAAPMPGYSRIAAMIKRMVPNAYEMRRAVQQRFFDQGMKRRRPLLYHEPSLWPFEFEGPMMMTLHDLAHVHYPHTQPVDRLRQIERHTEGALRRAARIVVDSRFIAGEVIRHYSIPQDKLVVAPLGHAPRFRPRTDEQLRAVLGSFVVKPRQYVLCIGALDPRKNLHLAIESYLAIPESLRNRYPLLIAGMPGWPDEQLNTSLRRALSSEQIRLLGYQQDEVLAQLLAGARLLLFPSRYEGFGLPVVEAMASGTPVVLSRRAALPEVAGEAGYYIEPDDVPGCALALQHLMEDEDVWHKQRMAGLARARAFTWARCAQITASAYREIMS